MHVRPASPVRTPDALRVAAGPGRFVAARASLRLLMVANPHASTTTDTLRREVLALLARRHTVDCAATGHRGHAIDLCRAAAADGYDAVVVLGGDGTINEAANGLVGSRTALAPLPGGATNVYARMLGIPRDVLAAAERLGTADLRVRDVDVGCVNERWFTFSAGVGLDASVVERVDRHPRRKARWGRWFFAGVGLSVFLRHYVRNPPSLAVETADRRLEAVSVLVQNGTPYTYFGERPIVLAPDEGLQSGGIGGVALTRARPTDLPPVLWRALVGRRPVGGHPRVEQLIVGGRLLVRSRDGRPVPVQVDGDHVGDHLEARFTVRAGGLRVLY